MSRALSGVPGEAQTGDIVAQNEDGEWEILRCRTCHKRLTGKLVECAAPGGVVAAASEAAAAAGVACSPDHTDE